MGGRCGQHPHDGGMYEGAVKCWGAIDNRPYGDE